MIVPSAISNFLTTKSGSALIAVLLVGTINPLPAIAGSKRSHVLVSEVTQPPVGWIEFCARQPGEDHSGGQLHTGQKISGEFAVAGGDGPEVLDSTRLRSQ
jgi:hypothetical protein